MTIIANEKVAVGWIKKYDKTDPNYEINQHETIYWEYLQDKIYNGRTCISDRIDSWEIIKLIIEKTEDVFIICNVSAGPLEDFIAKFGSEYIVKIEQEVTSNPKFARALGGVWKNLMADSVWDEIQRIVEENGIASL